MEEVVTDKNNYYTGERVHACINTTNNFNKRVEFDVFYNLRCSSTGSNFDVERSILSEHREFRAVNPMASQYQCTDLNIPFRDHLLYQTSKCYVSITVQSPYINTFDNKKLNISSEFNVTDYGMYPEYEADPEYPLIRLFPDWRRFDDVIDGVDRSYFRAKINITKLNESFLDPNDKITDDDWDVYTIFSDRMPCSTNIYNYTVELANGTISNIKGLSRDSINKEFFIDETLSEKPKIIKMKDYVKEEEYLDPNYKINDKQLKCGDLLSPWEKFWTKLRPEKGSANRNSADNTPDNMETPPTELL